MAAAYTEKEIDEIAAWLKEGLSASRIAGRFSALRGSPVTRNAIIGIVHRNAGLRAIGFANPKGGRAGGRPRKQARPDRPGRRGRTVVGGMALSEPAALSRYAELVEGAGGATADLPPCGGDVRQDRGGCCPADVSVVGNPTQAQTTARTSKSKRPKPRKPARTLPPAWLAPGERQKSEAQLYKLPAPPPAVNPGRQPHVAAMRFLDCLFGRCRAPLDLALREEPETDPLGARPGPDMLCCGLPTSATRSYCAHHHARFHGHRGRGM
ncbi:GcrA cell cycle regulator [Mesorhizobium sp. M2D.F.Ca.ET.185.01.1.1]|uniref:GcrA cell cycle regulator n=1 Tax=unclassified Mesorhizobium TaxID=325217 RepID=UPI000FCC64E3|nr:MULTISPECIES: GcrA cell cycle regulator [unclassified Mesorhizobium]TGP74860.1 GcrA cell cycle regulator [bacterium M00.F.Ca.ET.227.01.1.1]TGP84756.1 GcrA cell cycle regulator [bacterium M00.F.Ca.ET.221.01.1.1]TGP87812.1 GcrA cell cycle regulator [bacterium M00.F.Ca.ET.222.01.1.1]TGT97543.1 GcrA cell cycle regulator [bacterium M00.F.Ca.ET.163.01.1.1]TGU21861.1 GcrA cell cycle regulator [bacterium M00.F.Ca.ET.156.01.1.1]TGU42496.1 GcrA cell cycle regulator [bacterium M00.F.Ca.ET.146.01.1.1]